MNNHLDVASAIRQRFVRALSSENKYMFARGELKGEIPLRVFASRTSRRVFTTYSRTYSDTSVIVRITRACSPVPPIIVMTMLSRRRSLSRSRDPRRVLEMLTGQLARGTMLFSLPSIARPRSSMYRVAGERRKNSPSTKRIGSLSLSLSPPEKLLSRRRPLLADRGFV